MKTQTEVRNSFWEAFPEFKKEYKRKDVPQLFNKPLVRYVEKRQNDYNATIRSAFCMYVDGLEKDGIISHNLAINVTL